MVDAAACPIRDATELPGRYGEAMTDMPVQLPTKVPPAPIPTTEERTYPVPATAPQGSPRTGIVFVHGIGTQVARETLFDWAWPIIDVLGAWRRESSGANGLRVSLRCLSGLDRRRTTGAS